MKTWDVRIKELEGDGWTVSTIADAIGLSPQSVSDIKHGRTRAPVGYAAVRLYDLAGKRPAVLNSAPISKESALASAPKSASKRKAAA